MSSEMETPAEVRASLELPELGCTTVSLLGAEEKVLEVVHLAKPRTASFSQKKRQCDLWEFVWGSSLLTASFVAHLSLSGKRLLEIGGGAGMCSLAAVKFTNAAQVVMTDLVEDALKVFRQSAERNGLLSLNERLLTRKLDWNRRESVPEVGFDFVVGSDVLFFRGTLQPVAETCARALNLHGVGIVTDPCRSPPGDFEDHLRRSGFKTVHNLTFRPELVAQTKQDDAFVRAHRVNIFIFCKEESSPDMNAVMKVATSKFASHSLSAEEKGFT